MNRSFRPLALSVAMIVALGGCTVGPAYQRPVVPLPPAFREAGVEWRRVSPDDVRFDDTAWWRSYGDDELTQLVDQALAANATVAQAEARYRGAQAAVIGSRAGLSPALSVGGTGDRGSNEAGRQLRQAIPGIPDSAMRSVTHSVSYQANASWEPDLWGRVRSDVAAKHAQAEASSADLAAQRLSIIGALIADYLALRQYDVDVALLERQRDLYAQRRDIVEATQRQGGASVEDLLSARNSLDASVIALSTARISREQYEHAIATLCGKAPGDFRIDARTDYAFVAPDVPASIPADLLRRRPDVVSAERQIAAANAGIGVARAAYFPSIALTAGAGYSGSSMSGLFSAPHELWSLGAQVAGTLFDGGARRAGVDQAVATYDEAVAAWRQAVLTAMQEVEDDLSSLNHLSGQAWYSGTTRARQEHLLANRDAQYRLGTASMQDVLAEELSTLQARMDDNDAKAGMSLASVKLRVASGGATASSAEHVAAYKSLK